MDLNKKFIHRFQIKREQGPCLFGRWLCSPGSLLQQNDRPLQTRKRENERTGTIQLSPYIQRKELSTRAIRTALFIAKGTTLSFLRNRSSGSPTEEATRFSRRVAHSEGLLSQMKKLRWSVCTGWMESGLYENRLFESGCARREAVLKYWSRGESNP